MDAAELQESTRQLLEEEPLLEGRDLDAKVRVLLRSEYLRRFGRHRHVDHLMARKYGMEFEDFIARRLVKERDFSWDVESDAMNWESAVSGMKTIERKIEELRKADRV
jgi:hypothetical protein